MPLPSTVPRGFRALQRRAAHQPVRTHQREAAWAVLDRAVRLGDLADVEAAAHGWERVLEETRDTVAGVGDLDGLGLPLLAWARRWARAQRPGPCPEVAERILEQLLATAWVVAPARRSSSDAGQAWALILQRDDAGAARVWLGQMAPRMTLSERVDAVLLATRHNAPRCLDRLLEGPSLPVLDDGVWEGRLPWFDIPDDGAEVLQRLDQALGDHGRSGLARRDTQQRTPAQAWLNRATANTSLGSYSLARYRRALRTIEAWNGLTAQPLVPVEGPAWDAWCRTTLPLQAQAEQQVLRRTLGTQPVLVRARARL